MKEKLMQNYFFENYQIQITEKTDFDEKNCKYPQMEPFFCCKQIHSNQIHEWHSGWENTIEGDGILTDQNGIWLKVGVSDCNPVVIMGKRRFGIVHAGWRGLQQGIIQKLFQKLKEKGESDFSVFVGPSIRKCCYEVGDEFASRCAPQFLIPKKQKKWHLDMLAMIQEILKNFSCKKICIHQECTKCGKNFFSYRKRDGINNFVLVRKK